MSDIETYNRMAIMQEMAGDYFEAVKFYEKGNIHGKNDLAINRCRTNMGYEKLSLTDASDSFLSDIFNLFTDCVYVRRGWSNLGEHSKALLSLLFMSRVIRGLNDTYNSYMTGMMIYLSACCAVEYEYLGDYSEANSCIDNLAAECINKDTKPDFAFLKFERDPQLVIEGNDYYEAVIHILEAEGKIGDRLRERFCAAVGKQ